MSGPAGAPALALDGPGPAALCPGIVMHHRHRPVDHRFTYPVSLLWLDPDRPGELDGHHPLCSTRHPALLRFRRSDYLDGADTPLGPAVRTRLAEALGTWPTGPLRMLTQPRTWGWLFNPITIYLVWPPDSPDAPGSAVGPVAALLEVTNTPWKERHSYAVALSPEPVGAGPAYRAGFAKVLHVSPFLGEAFDYRLGLRFSPTGPDRRLTVDLDVLPHGPGDSPGGAARIQGGSADEGAGGAEPGPPVLTTRLVVDQRPLERTMLSQTLRRNPLPTHRVSFGIHRQALRLWRRGVPFVAHPRQRTPEGSGGTPVEAVRP